MWMSISSAITIISFLLLWHNQIMSQIVAKNWQESITVDNTSMNPKCSIRKNWTRVDLYYLYLRTHCGSNHWSVLTLNTQYFCTDPDSDRSILIRIDPDWDRSRVIEPVLLHWSGSFWFSASFYYFISSSVSLFSKEQQISLFGTFRNMNSKPRKNARHWDTKIAKTLKKRPVSSHDEKYICHPRSGYFVTVFCCFLLHINLHVISFFALSLSCTHFHSHGKISAAIFCANWLDLYRVNHKFRYALLCWLRVRQLKERYIS